MSLSTEAVQTSKDKAKASREKQSAAKNAKAEALRDKLGELTGEAYEITFTGEWRTVGQLKPKQYGGWWWSEAEVALFKVDDLTLAVSDNYRTGVKATVVQECSECGEPAYISDDRWHYENRIQERPFRPGNYRSSPFERAEAFREQVGKALRRKPELRRCFTCNARAMQATCECCGRPHA